MYGRHFFLSHHRTIYTLFDPSHREQPSQIVGDGALFRVNHWVVLGFYSSLTKNDSVPAVWNSSWILFGWGVRAFKGIGGVVSFVMEAAPIVFTLIGDA